MDDYGYIWDMNRIILQHRLTWWFIRLIIHYKIPIVIRYTSFFSATPLLANGSISRRWGR